MDMIEIEKIAKNFDAFLESIKKRISESPQVESGAELGRAEKATAREAQRFNLEDIFTHHAPSPFDFEKYKAIRTAAKFFAQVVLDNTPLGADQSDAIRKLRECVMTANAAIALRGRL